jgi:hypothetical protein
MNLIHVGLRHGPGPDGIGRLDEMIEAAIHGSPEVRAAEARLHMAQAELEQARLHAVERVVAYRRQRRAQQAELEAAEAELQQANRAASSASNDARQKELQELVSTANLRVQALRQQMAETEATTPFLFAARPVHASAQDAQESKMIEEELLPKAEQILKVLHQAYQQGEGDLDAIFEWSRRVVELELRL